MDLVHTRSTSETAFLPSRIDWAVPLVGLSRRMLNVHVALAVRRWGSIATLAVVALFGLEASGTAEPHTIHDGLWIIDVDGSDMRKLVDSGFDYHASPSTAEAVYLGPNDPVSEPADVFLRHIDDGSEESLTSSAEGEHDPRFSPDAQSVAFTREMSEDRSLFVTDRDGSDESEVATLDEAIIREPRWSPDGSRIAFVAEGNEQVAGLWVVDWDGDHFRRLSSREPLPQGPTWSPDGAWIAFAVAGYDIYVVGSDGVGEYFLGDDAECCHEQNPEWSRDGGRILYDNRQHIWTIEPDGDRYSGRGMGGQGIEPHWGPNGEDVAYTATGAGVGLAFADGNVSHPTFEERYYDPDEFNVQWTADGRVMFERLVWQDPPPPIEVERRWRFEWVSRHGIRGFLRPQHPVCTRHNAFEVEFRRSSLEEWRRIRGRSTGWKGKVRLRLPHREGWFRLIAPRWVKRDLDGDVRCHRAVSRALYHSHE